ncbi:hypothetical protein N0V90_003491 [Kalmusia sp. IMI 367209]|nr:hypothetical protein N0V90_003491 [Kalmusia sp. IMI 367209]
MLPPIQKNEIRILSIPPAPRDVEYQDQLECDVHTALITDLPDYESLSYVWGTDTDFIPIIISGHPFMISQTLHGALRRLQLPDRRRLLWIDQICIDQHNTEEKAEQVQLMSTIYTRCSNCIVWMGEVKDGVPLEDVDAAIQLLQYMARARRSRNPSSLPFPPALPDRFEVAIEALRGITKQEHQWWNRIWTVQEAALPEHVTLQWGQFQITWTDLQQVREAWVRPGYYPEPLRELVARYHPAHNVIFDLVMHVTWVNVAREPYFHDPFETIHRYRFRQATNPRDKIYGLLGLCEPGLLPITEKCDYDVPTAQVFTTLTQELIIAEEGLRPLTLSPRQNLSESTPNISSWALDLDHVVPKYSADPYYQMYGYEHYEANKGMRQLDVRAIKKQVGQRTLSLTGVYVDTIKHTLEGYRTHAEPQHNFAATEALLHEWYIAAVGCPFGADRIDGSVADELYPGSTYTRAEAFARFVLGDLIRDENLQPQWYADEDDVENVWRLMNGRIDEVEEETRQVIYLMMANLSMFVTEMGLFGCGHLDTGVGDEVWVFRGGNVPFLIRPRNANGEDGHTFVSQCYVQGIMKGEMASSRRRKLWKLLRKAGHRRQRFRPLSSSRSKGGIEQTVCLY